MLSAVVYVTTFVMRKSLHKCYGEDPSSENSSISRDTSSFLGNIDFEIFFPPLAFLLQLWLALKRLRFFVETPFLIALQSFLTQHPKISA